MAEVRLLCCGVSAEWFGAESISRDVPSGWQLRQFAERLAAEYPGFAEHRHGVAFAAGDRLLTADAPLDSVTEIAVIPPVSGG